MRAEEDDAAGVARRSASAQPGRRADQSTRTRSASDGSVGRGVDAGELDPGGAGGGLDPAVDHQVGEDRSDLHPASSTSGSGASGAG